jgi:hypothetical protein
MANRYMVRNMMSLEKAPVVLYGNIAIGATGAPTINALKSLGISSISRSSAGKYVLVLGGPAGKDSYQRLLQAQVNFLVSTTSAVCSVSVAVDNSAGTTPSITIQCVDFAGAAVDPASGEVMLVKLELDNSSVAA